MRMITSLPLACVTLTLLMVGALVGCASNGSSGGTAGSETSPTKPRARVKLVKSRSHCQQDHVVGNVDVVVTLKNTGGKDESNVSILPIREYASGREVRPIGDTMVDVEVKADRKPHTVWNSYGVGAGNEIVACRLKIIGSDSFDPDEEIPIKVRGNG